MKLTNVRTKLALVVMLVLGVQVSTQAAAGKDSAARSHRAASSQGSKANSAAGRSRQAAQGNPRQNSVGADANSAEIARLKEQITLQQQQIQQLLQASSEQKQTLDKALRVIQSLETAQEAASTEGARAQGAPPPSPGVVADTSVQLDHSSALVHAATLATPAQATHQSPSAQPGGLNTLARPASLGQVASLSPVIPSSAVAASAVPPVSLETPPAPVLGGGSPTPEEKQPKLSDLAFGKVKIGATFYGDYAYYTATGFGPQFLTQINQAGPGNDGFNSFDITRTYINFLYTPNDAITLRITPNIYRQVDVSGATGFGKGAAIASSSNGNLGFRLKYAYVDFNKPFSHSEAFGKDKLTLGETTNPLVDWEEVLYGYRYVNLVPWNYLSLSSTYLGATLHGPIEWNGKEYLDYHLAVFNTASFHAIEQNDKKQVMGRLTWYPAGTTSDRTGFGVTAFMDYGYSTKTPDTRSIPLYRFSALAHYQTHSKNYLIAGEYDLGRNAFSTGNLFSGVGPADEFGLGPTIYAASDALAKALLGGDHTRQRGFDFFGHARLGKSPIAVFGMFEYFQPNTKVNDDPLDFRRLVAGLSYKYNEHFEIALDNQNLTYTKSQFTFPSSELAKFSSSLASANANGIPNAVPQNTNGIFLNLLFSY